MVKGLAGVISAALLVIALAAVGGGKRASAAPLAGVLPPDQLVRYGFATRTRERAVSIHTDGFMGAEGPRGRSFYMCLGRSDLRRVVRLVASTRRLNWVTFTRPFRRGEGSTLETRLGEVQRTVWLNASHRRLVPRPVRRLIHLIRRLRMKALRAGRPLPRSRDRKRLCG